MYTGHFPWIFALMKYAFLHSEPGKAALYVKQVALDLVKSRRESGHSEKVRSGKKVTVHVLLLSGYHCQLLQYKDILQLMIEASGEEEDSSEEERETETNQCPVAHKQTKTAVMTDEEVVANSFGFLFAGNETTAITLSFASYQLALNPDVQEKLQSEIDAYFEDKPVSSCPYCLDTPHHTCPVAYHVSLHTTGFKSLLSCT